jgi:Uma2 family endonuclease
MSMPLARRSFTVEEYHRMARAGVFAEDDRVELLDGEIVEMTLIGPGSNRLLPCVSGDGSRRGRHSRVAWAIRQPLTADR